MERVYEYVFESNDPCGNEPGKAIELICECEDSVVANQKVMSLKTACVRSYEDMGLEAYVDEYGINHKHWYCDQFEGYYFATKNGKLDSTIEEIESFLKDDDIPERDRAALTEIFDAIVDYSGYERKAE